MALDHSIYNLVGPSVPKLDLMSSIMQGIDARNAIRQAPLIEALQRAKIEKYQRDADLGRNRFIGTPQRITRGGQDFLAGLVQLPTGEITLSETPVKGQFVSVLGETAAEEEARKIREARQRAKIGVQAEGEKVGSKGRATRIQGAIENGLDAVDSVSDVSRAIELLESVGTGKPQSLLLSAKQRLGIDAADEGELKTLLGRSVLGNLRASFGGNPTEGERAALAEVEASFGQQGEVNKRLLNRTLDKLERRIRRGLAAAKKDNDEFSVERLEGVIDQIEQIKGIKQQATTKGSSEPQVLRFDAQGNLIQ